LISAQTSPEGLIAHGVASGGRENKAGSGREKESERQGAGIAALALLHGIDRATFLAFAFLAVMFLRHHDTTVRLGWQRSLRMQGERNPSDGQGKRGANRSKNRLPHDAEDTAGASSEQAGGIAGCRPV
jgi:hypothetical protein